MFGLFGGDIAKIRRLRTEFEDIRQRVLYKMNGYEQYSFASALDNLCREINVQFESFSVQDFDKWIAAADQLRNLAQSSWKSARGLGGIAAEGAVAGSEALALLSLKAASNGYHLAEAHTLRTDIRSFEQKVLKYLAERKNLYDMIPKD